MARRSNALRIFFHNWQNIAVRRDRYAITEQTPVEYSRKAVRAKSTNLATLGWARFIGR